MLNLKAWLIVKLWTWWYYITHPGMYWERVKLRNKNSQKMLDLFIGHTTRKKKMIDKEHDDFNWKLIINWSIFSSY